MKSLSEPRKAKATYNLDMFNLKAKEEHDYYYDGFRELARFSVDIGTRVLMFLKEFKPEKAESFMVEIHEIEHQADLKKHELTKRLMRSKYVPFGKENIFQLLRLIDDITDAIEEIPSKLHLYNYQTLPSDAISFMELVLECLTKTEETIDMFASGKEAEHVFPLLEAIASLEQQADTEYANDIASLYRSDVKYMEVRRAETLYSLLETVTDCCREVATYIQALAFEEE